MPLRPARYALGIILLVLASASPCGAYSWTPISSGTAVQAGHLNEIYTNLNSKRVDCGVAPYAWPAGLFPVARNASIQSVHINTLRAAVRDYYTARGQAAPGAIAGSVVSASAITAAQITALQQAVETAPCCTCTGWSNIGCGPVGSCGESQMYQTRTCNPVNCLPQSQCGSASCPTTYACGFFGCQSGLGESCANCPGDCGSCCGNGSCDNGETYATCPADCPCYSDGSCSAAAPSCGQTTYGTDNCGTACSLTGAACCGNGYCGESGENCSSCAVDCGACCVPVNGGWSTSDGWGGCQQRPGGPACGCGQGIQYSYHTCTNPTPNACGAACPAGGEVTSRACNLTPCVENRVYHYQRYSWQYAACCGTPGFPTGYPYCPGPFTVENYDKPVWSCPSGYTSFNWAAVDPSGSGAGNCAGPSPGWVTADAYWMCIEVC